MVPPIGCNFFFLCFCCNSLKRIREKRRAAIRAKEMENGLEWKSMEAILDNEEGLNYIEETGVSSFIGLFLAGVIPWPDGRKKDKRPRGLWI